LRLRLAQFDQQIRTEGTRTDFSFANATIRRRDVKESEQPTHVQEHAIIDYAQVLDQLHAALAALMELEEPKRTLPWHKLPLRGSRRAACVTTHQAAGTRRPTPQGGSDRQFAR
jgi:predicted DCC family thiol-disulfide oxidoreductase YuxK